VLYVTVVLDQRSNSCSDTGHFELIYRATTNPNTRGCDCKFIVAGQRINKLDLQRFIAIDRKVMRQQEKAGERRDDDVTSSTGACGSHAHKISLVQLADTAGAGAGRGEAGGGECGGEYSGSSSQQGSQNSGSSSANVSNKNYRGLRQSTVEIYNGR